VAPGKKPWHRRAMSFARRPRKGPKPASPELLEKAALHYLERYASSAQNLRRVLMRRVDRSARFHGTDRSQGAAWVDALVARYAGAGLIDDRKYAEAAAESLRRRGASARRIRQKLAQKGVDADVAQAALKETGGAGEEADLAAAVAFARKRRLGPYGDPKARRDRRLKDMAALARAGFSYAIARKVVDAENEDGPGGG
jgi:regulatory protein